MKNILFIAFSAFLFSSCVTSKVHEDLQGRYDILNTENDNLRKKSQELEVSLNELEAEMKRAEKDMKTMEGDTVALGYDLRKMRKNYNDLNKQYEFLLNNNSSLLADNARQNKALLERLEVLQEELDLKQDSLNDEQAKLAAYEAKLLNQNKRLVMLEGELSKQDSTMRYIQDKLSNALMGFEGKGLTIERRNGKVYISLENSLLFASGSWMVSTNGKMALNNLGDVLAANKDINVLVEGHTDNDAYRGSGQVKDNWDLSVMRSTSVVKILVAKGNGLETRVTAAGRGEFIPLASNKTKDGKAENRRIEIILTPDLGDLLEMVDNE